ncbi:alpha/beta hydrolase [Nocardia sp. NPDC059228]|uniref:alpha/beta hydrolase n=1 Tax=Nocardia sp. NPDC059228 TaxID=3346777 RepID=UPI0036BD20F1
MIWRPPGASGLGWLVGMQWPEGNEDLMWAIADDWKSSAGKLRGIDADIDEAIAAVRRAYPTGDGGDKIIAQLQGMRTGDQSIDKLAEWFETISGTANNTGTQLEYTKLMFYTTLLTLAADIAAAWLFPPTAPMAEGAIIGVGRITVRILTRRAIDFLGKEAEKATEIAMMKFIRNQVLIGGALGALQDGAIQAYQSQFGRRDGIDMKQLGLSAAGGAAGGLLAAPIGRLAPKAMLNAVTKQWGKDVAEKMVTQKAANLLSGGIAGGVAGLGGWAVSGGITHNWHFDPRVVTAGIAGGTLPGVAHEAPSRWKGGEPKLDNAGPKTDGAPSALSEQHKSNEIGNGQLSQGEHVQPGPARDASLTENAPREGAPTSEKLTGGATPAHLQATDTQVRPIDSGVSHAPPPTGAQVVPNAQAPAHGGPVAEARPIDAQATNSGHTPTSADQRQTPAVARAETPVAPRADTPSVPKADAPAATQARADAPGSTTPAADPRATAAAVRDGVQLNPMSTRATGLEAQPRVIEHTDLAQSGRTAEPVTGRPDARDLVGAGSGPAARIGARPEGPSNHQSGSPEHPKAPAEQRSPNHGAGIPADPVGAHGPQTHDPAAFHPAGRDPENPVLPKDSPLTEAEHAHAREALDRLGPEATPEHLAHELDTSVAEAHNRASENHEWWKSLTPEQQDAMLRVHPHELGNADGIPPHIRDEANRLSIARDINEMREQNPRIDKFMTRFTDPESFRQWKNLQSTVEALQHADELARNFARDNAGHEPPVQVLSYDSTAFGGEGRAVVAFGDTQHASTVSVHVPGITTTVRSLGSNLDNACNHFKATSERRDPAEVASIVWIGYDAPSGFPKILREMTDARMAARGGQLLARDMAAFSQTRRLEAGLPGGSPTPDVHLFGHSYGSTTTSFAGAGGRLSGDVSTITLLGSPGTGPVGHAADFGIGAHNVYVASSSRDPVTWIGANTHGEISRMAPGLGNGLGMDPAIAAFGANRIAAQFPGGIHTLSDISTHTGYYNYLDKGATVPTESLHNFARIANGETPHILPEYSRPGREDLNAWQRNVGSLPHDPARFRGPEPEVHQGKNPYGYGDLVEHNRATEPAPTAPERTHEPVNDCGPQALRQVHELTGNPEIHVPDDPHIAEHGMTAAELENAAGAHLDRHETLGSIADQLHRLGDGATALVVDEFRGPMDANNIGAHAYTITNDGGRLVVHDNAVPGGPHPFPPDHTNVKSTHAIVYDSHGNPVHPLESSTHEVPAAFGPEARIGQPDSHPRLPVEDKPYYANPHYQDPRVSHEYAAKNNVNHREIQTTREIETANYPEISRLSDAEMDAIRRNQFFNLNEPVNDATRNGNPRALHDQDVEIRTLMSAYNKLPDHEGTVYRSLRFDDEAKLVKFLDEYAPGKEPVDRGFASSDRDSSMPGGNVELIIDSHSGKDISWSSPSQAEVVFPPGTKFRVESHHYEDGKHYIHLTDLGRTSDVDQPRGNGPDRADSARSHHEPWNGRPGDPSPSGTRDGGPAREGGEGTPVGHRGPDQDLAGVGRVGDHPDQPRAGRDGLTHEEPSLTHPNEVPHPEEPHRELPSHINGPDEHYVPFLADSGQPRPDSVHPHPTEPSHPEQAAPRQEPEKLHPDSRERSPHSEPTNDGAHPNAEHELTAQELIHLAEPEAVAPAHDPIQRFDTPEAARHYGDEMLAPIRDTMSEPELRELQRYTKKSWINEFLRAENPVKMLAKLAEDEGHYQQLRRVTNGSPIMPRVEVLDRILAEHPDRRDPYLDPRLRATIEHVVNDPNPHGRLQELSRNADKLPMMREYFGGEPTMDVLRSQVEHLDQAMNRPIPEGVEVSRGISMRSLDRFIGPDGQPLNGRNPMLLKGTVQTEHGYMSTSLGPTPPQEFRLKVRVELEVPADSKGAWVGDKGLAGPENELILQRESKFLITDVIEDPKGARYDDGYVDYLVKGKLVSADYVHEPNAEVPQAPDRNTTPDRRAADPVHPIDVPDKDTPLRLDNEPQRPVESPDRPSTLTPHLIDRFKELHERLYDVASAHHDPTRAPELPGLRLGLNDLMDKLGMLDHETSPTAMRLFEEYRPDLAKYLSENYDTFRPHPSDTATPPHEPVPHTTDHSPEPSEHRPTDPEHRPNDPEHRTNADDPQPNSSHPIDEHNPPADPLSHYADRTPAGLSLHNDPELHALAHQVPEDPRFFTIDAHLTERGTVLLDGREYTMEELAARLPDLGYDGRPIRLIGCDAASTDAAARLAEATNNYVLAPTKPAWTDPEGHVYSSTADTTSQGTRRPRIPPDGDWDLIHPNGTKTKVSEDGFVPGTREEDKHGIDAADARDRGEDGTPETPYELPGEDRVIHTDDSDFDELFVEWNRPTHKPPDPLNPHLPRQPIDVQHEIVAPHRDRETVPDGNTEPGKLKPVEHPETVPEPLRAHFGDEPLKPWSAYPVVNENGTRTTFFTNGDGTVKWVEATPGSRALALDKKGPWSGFNPDLSFPLLPDVQYQVPNVHNNDKLLSFHTDSHGQTDALTGDIEAGGQNRAYRDDDGGKGAQQRAYQEGEAAYPSNPGYELTAAELEKSRIKWAGGHLLANELGGLGEYLNMHPQMAASNSGNRKDGWMHEASWRAKENQLVAFANEEYQDIRNYQVKMTREADGVPSDVIMRWQEVTYVRNGDGRVHLDVDGKPVVQSVVTKERVFPNREANFGPQDRYKNR